MHTFFYASFLHYLYVIYLVICHDLYTAFRKRDPGYFFIFPVTGIAQK